MGYVTSKFSGMATPVVGYTRDRVRAETANLHFRTVTYDFSEITGLRSATDSHSNLLLKYLNCFKDADEHSLLYTAKFMLNAKWFIQYDY